MESRAEACPIGAPPGEWLFLRREVQRLRLGREGRRTVVREFGIETTVKKTEDLYRTD